MTIRKKNKIAVVYQDDRGYIVVYLDDNGILFKNGKAYFSDGKNDYAIDTSCLVSIG